MINDCRCADCGCCKHDHGGWKHEWVPKPINVRGHCSMCGEPWYYDQPVCANAYCPSHDEVNCGTE
jgi:hypothetical protein